MRKHALYTLFLTLFLTLLAPAAALAVSTDNPAQPVTLALPYVQLIALALGGLMQLATYLLNHYAPWTSEKVKGIVTVIVAAIVGFVVDGLVGGTFAFDEQTLQLSITAVLGALTAHKLLWVPSEISSAFGGGSNR